MINTITRASMVLACILFNNLVGCDHRPSDGRPFHLLKKAGDLEEGRKQYDAAIISSKLPRYGNCWKMAVQRLHIDCDSLTDDSHSRLALLFTNCFLGKSGQQTYPCQSTDEPSSCTRSMDTTAFHAYTTFFTHTHNMCYFVKSQVWHEETEGTINRLLDTSNQVQSRMIEHMELQQRSLDNERQILDRGRELELMLVDFQEVTGEQRLFIAQMFDHVVKFHSIVIGEFAGVYSLVFFVISVTLCYLLTSAQRTAAARFWLFCIMVVNLVVEKFAIEWRLEENVRSNSEDVQGIIYNRIWVVRRISSWLAFVTLSVFAYRYRDIQVVNNELLKVISRQNLEIKLRLNVLDHVVLTSKSLKAEVTETQFNTSSSDEPLFDTSSSGEEMFKCNCDTIPSINMVTPIADVFTAISNSFTGTLKKEPKKIGRPKRDVSLNDSLEQYSPRESPYNLRNRKPVTLNPIVDVEPPERFAATIKQLAKISAANSENVRQAMKQVKKQRTIRSAHLSSDED